MELSDWVMSNQGLLRNNSVYEDSKFNIIHLDDNRLFKEGLQQTITIPFFSNTNLDEF